MFQAQFPHTAVYLINGEMFSWYGSRLLLATDYFSDLVTMLDRR